MELPTNGVGYDDPGCDPGRRHGDTTGTALAEAFDQARRRSQHHGQQRDNIAAVFGEQARVMTVVGFKLESILEAFPDGLFVYNENFDTTNTSKSLLKVLRFSGEARSCG